MALETALGTGRGGGYGPAPLALTIALLAIAACSEGNRSAPTPTPDEAVAGTPPGPAPTTPIELPPAPPPPGLESIAVTPDGTKAYLAYAHGPRLTVIDAVNDLVLGEVAIPRTRPARLPVRLAIDPEGRHLFVVDAVRRELLVLDTATDTLAPSIPVPGACRGIAFDFSGGTKRIYVTNQRDNAVLVFHENPDGVFNAQPSLPLDGRGPGPIAVQADGKLLVGDQRSRELEVLDPTLAPANASIARTGLSGVPYDVVVSGARALVPTFTPTPGGQEEGRNEVLEVELTGHTVVDAHAVDLGANYWRLVGSSQDLLLLSSASGSALVLDPSDLALVESVELAPGDPISYPVDAALVPSAGGGVPQKAYVVNRMRRTVRPIDLSGGAPFALLPEIVLDESGQARLPKDLGDEEAGEWWFMTGAFLNGTAANPNLVSCATCHPRAGADPGIHTFFTRNPFPFYFVTQTPPFGATSVTSNLKNSVRAAFFNSTTVGGNPPPGSEDAILAFLDTVKSPPSPFREADGSLSAQAQAGKLVFENQAGCAVCHPAPLFIPADPAQRTIAGGVGTGLVPANIPTLRGLWNTEPYLHDASAATLMDVLLQNPGDQHGTTSTLTPTERTDLVAYLLSL